MKRTGAFFITVLSLAASGAHAATLYKCRTADGGTTFRDTPCEQGSSVVEKRNLKGSPPRPDNIAGGVEYVEQNGLATDPQAVYLMTARFSNVLASLMPVKQAITAYHYQQGGWPQDLKALGFDPEAMHSPEVTQVKLGKEGSIIARLDATLGEDKQLWLIPNPVMSDTQLQWNCYSNFPKEVFAVGERAICESRVFY